MKKASHGSQMADFREYSNYADMIGNNDWFNKRIKTIPGIQLGQDIIVEINANNSKCIEDAIQKDDSYNLTFYDKIFKFYGGIAGFQKDNREAVLAVIRMIDMENSTNMWRMKGNRRKTINNMVEYICDKEKHFWEDLKNGCIELVDKLTDAGKEKDGVDGKSLSSKVCKYFNRLYGGDAYYINDEVVRRVLPYYMKYYDVKLCGDILPKSHKGKYNIDKMSYEKLYKCLDALKNEADPDGVLSKTEFDHIMWYSYRKVKEVIYDTDIITIRREFGTFRPAGSTDKELTIDCACRKISCGQTVVSVEENDIKGIRYYTNKVFEKKEFTPAFDAGSYLLTETKDDHTRKTQTCVPEGYWTELLCYIKKVSGIEL